MTNTYANKNNTFIEALKIKNNLFQINSKLYCNNEIKDFINFITKKKGSDMLPYSFMTKKDVYNQLISKSEDYYLFKDETATINKALDCLKVYLKNVKRFIEIGPGSPLSIQNKTFPIINCVPLADTYFAIDISSSYLNKTYNFVKSFFPDFNIKTFELDLLNLKNLSKKNSSNQTCILFLGGTLGNFTQKTQQKILDNISSICNKEDFFIISVDLNNDPISLEKAYNCELAHDLLRNALSYFYSTYEELEFDINNFDIKFRWVKSSKHVSLYYEANKNFQIKILNKNIDIQKGQKFYGVKSRKFDESIINHNLNKSGFLIIDKFQNSNKILTILCKKS